MITINTDGPVAILSSTHSADVRPGTEARPVIRVFENGQITPGQWYAETLAAGFATFGGIIPLAIDAGAGWTLTETETYVLRSFAAELIGTI